MVANYIPRNTVELAEEIMSDTPVLTISGARQVGKSTLAQALARDRRALVLNLDERAIMLSARMDPDGFVRQHSDGLLVIDEVQRVPELLQAIKASLEEDRRPRRFLITGSSNVYALQGGQESLAGRAETISLRGFSQGERRGYKEDFVACLLKHSPGDFTCEELERSQYFDLVTQPSFPEIAEASERRVNRWVDGYVERVLSRDVADLVGIEYPDRLEKLLHYIAAQGSAEFVAAKVGRRLNIPERTVPAYLDALKNVFLVDVLPAWGTNVAKRVISKPKVQMQDTGMAASLAGLDARALELQISSSVRGGLVEAFAASELLKQKAWSDVDYRLFHFRQSTGSEVDLVVETRSREIIGIEIKAAVSIAAKDFAGLRALQKIASEKFRIGVVLYAGTRVLPMGEGLWAMPISALWGSAGR